MKKLYFFVLLTISSYFVQGQSRIDISKLTGTWKGNYDTLNAVLNFNADYTGSVKWSNTEKMYVFKYFFKNRSILCIYDRSTKNYHQIIFTDNTLRLSPYPKALRESIDLIDVVKFHRINSNLSKTD